MTKSDQTDLQILAELDINARQTNSEIGRKLDMTRTTVASRIEDLEKSGLLTKCVPIIDFFALGYSSFQLYFNLQHTNRTIEQEMVDYMIKSPYIRECSDARGGFDIDCVSWFRTQEQFNSLWDGFREKFKMYIKESSVIPIYGKVRSSFPFTEQNSTGNNVEIGTSKPIKIDETDRTLLRLLSANGRASFSHLSRAMGLSPGAVKHRVDQLVKKKVIKGFRPFAYHHNIGFNAYKVGLDLASLINKEKIEQFVLDKPSVVHVLRNVGGPDVEFTVHTKSEKEFYEVLHEIRDEFPEDIRNFNFLTYPRTFKEDFMPSF